MQTLGKDRRRALLRALITGKEDVIDIARANRVSLEQLADWAEGDDVQRRLASLCSLADAQAQFQISRFRQFVAQQLMQDAMQEGGSELTRKARLDAMKAEVWQPYAPEEPSPSAIDPAGEDPETPQTLAAPMEQEGGDDARSL